MDALRGQSRALSNDSDLRRFVVQAIPTGVHLGTGSFGSVEEVGPSAVAQYIVTCTITRPWFMLPGYS